MPAAGADPRLSAAPGEEADVRPVVTLPRAGLPNWLIAVGIAAFALLLFVILDARRRAASAPPTTPAAGDVVRTAAPATPLYVPPAVVTVAPPPEAVTILPPPPPPPAPPPAPRIIYVPQPAPPQVALPEASMRPTAETNSPALIYDAGVADAAPGSAAAGPTDAAGATLAVTATARARTLANRATTVGQGTLIPAVLESALDSTRPGPARALVTRNVRGADGSRILIQRGSRLFGEYRADLATGQNRALITWTRLVRPDGAAVALGSPAADPLGRVGVKGKVDTHFLARFGAALLQSTLDVGVNLASRSVRSPVVVALPGIGQNSGAASPLLGTPQAQPTLKIKQGVSISVFVARDLDFTGVQRR